MDSDFHYYGTGTAALAAGFSTADAAQVANAAQYVDWFDSDYWSYWRIVDGQGSAVKNRATGGGYEYEYPQLSIQKIDWKMSVDYNPNIWNAFHFPPGNLPHAVKENGWRQKFAKRHVVRKTRLTRRDANKLCRPYSKFALDLIEDTMRNFRALSNATGPALDRLVARLVRPRVRCPVSDGPTMARFLLGVRMHVLADTWAHQDFAGEQNKDINGAGVYNEVTARDARGKWRDTEWTGTVWALRDDTDCAAAPLPTVLDDTVCAGHGQMGHYPDYSWLSYKYPAAWLPKGRSLHLRDNPKEYREAWSWLAFVMGLCSGGTTDDDLPKCVPQDIDRVMGTWHRLNPDRLEAIEESEKLWRKTRSGRKLPTRWNPARRAALGLLDGLAWTRYGFINVKRDSTLHYMETAAAMHYQFCVKWLKDNPAYAWTPWKPRT